MEQLSEEAEFEGWQRQADTGFPAYVGPFWSRDTDSGVILAFQPMEKHQNRRGVIHGGMLMTLADRAMGEAVRRATGGRSRGTIQLNIHFVQPARIGTLIEADCRIIRMTNTVVFVASQLTARNEVLATCNGIWKIRPPDKTPANQS